MPPERPKEGSHSTFVGRKRELAELDNGLEETRAGQGRFFLVTGEPGIGKTWLADEVARHAASSGVSVLRVGCWEGAGAPAYWPIIQLLRAALRGPDRDALLKLLSSGEGRQLAQELAQLIPELQPAPLASASPDRVSDPDQARFQLFDSVVTLLRGVAAARPLLLIVEDLHDADQPSLLMLRFVVGQLRDAPVLVLGTYRDVGLQHSAALSQVIGDLMRQGTEVPLFALGRDDAALMIESRAGAPASPRLVSDIHQAASGNPLFIDGLLRVLAADGQLGSARLNLTGFRVPHGVREAIRSWLDLVPDRSRLVVAAMIGQEFELRCLQRVTKVTTVQLTDELRQASLAGIVTPLPHGAYKFSHALIRNALNDEANSEERARIHLEIGQALEEIHGAEVEAHLAQLAHHFREAGDTEKAVAYLIRAGEAARAVFAYDEALAHWDAALELVTGLPEHRAQRASLLERSGVLLGLRESDGVSQLSSFRQALKLYRELGRPEAALRVEAYIAGFMMMHGVQAEALSPAPELNQLADGPSGQDRKTRISLLWRYNAEAATALEEMRVVDALNASRSAMEISEQLSDAQLWARTAVPHAHALFAQGQLKQAFALMLKAYEHGDRFNDNITAAGVLVLHCSSLSWLGDPMAGMARLERELNKPRMAQAPVFRRVVIDTLRLLRLQLGQPHEDRLSAADSADRTPSEHGTAARARGIAAYYSGDWEQADLVLSHEVDRENQNGKVLRACISMSWPARARRALGRHAAAEAILKEEIRVCCAGLFLPLELIARGELASLYAETGRPEQAHPHLERCREVIAQGEDWRGFVGQLARAEAMVSAAESRIEAANAQFAHAVEIQSRYQVPFEEAETLHHWGRVLLEAGARETALEKLDAAAEIYQRHGAGERWLERVNADRLRGQGSSVVPPDVTAQVRPRSRRGREEEPVEAAPMRGEFRRQGEYWTLSWAGSESRLKHRKGMYYIAWLLRHPGHEFPAQTLASAVEARDSLTAETSAIGHEFTTVSGGLGDAGAALDSTAKAQYRRRLEELRGELDLAQRLNDLGRVEKAREELEFIQGEISASVGLGGRDRKFASHAERSRLAVTKAIKASLSRIRQAHPELGRHLAISIQTGHFCAYAPAQPVDWQI